MHFRHFVDGDVRVKVISATDGARAAEIGFDDLDLHFAQQASDCGVHLGLWPVGTGIVDGYAQPRMVGQGEPVDTVQHFPEGNGPDALVKRTKSPVAAGAVVDDRRSLRQAWIVVAADVVHLHRPEPGLKQGQDLTFGAWLGHAQGAARVEPAEILIDPGNRYARDAYPFIGFVRREVAHAMVFLSNE